MAVFSVMILRNTYFWTWDKAQIQDCHANVLKPRQKNSRTGNFYFFPLQLPRSSSCARSPCCPSYQDVSLKKTVRWLNTWFTENIFLQNPHSRRPFSPPSLNPSLNGQTSNANVEQKVQTYDVKYKRKLKNLFAIKIPSKNQIHWNF